VSKNKLDPCHQGLSNFCKLKLKPKLTRLRTLDISTEDVEEVPSEDEAIAGAAALEADGDGLLKWLKRELRSTEL